ncbi:FAD-binding protein [Sphingobium sp. AN558]|uniref:FAD-binding protein n=1 Tax=Sphingobium sp. AN558 TaxID=3133442 RepID=UPI0030C276B9
MDPVVVDDVNALNWNCSADVVVIGYGGAGAAAALDAREQGAEVVVVERFGGGGATRYSGGIIYAGGTRFQKEAGYDDDSEKMCAYLAMEVGDAVRPETLRRFCDGSAADLDWLISHGVRFASSVYKEKTTFPPEGKFLYFSGNEKTSRFAAKTPPMPRGHRVFGPGYGGVPYFAAMAGSVDRLGVDVRRHEKANRLIVDKAGRVVGVEVISLPPSFHERHEKLYRKISPYVPFRNRTYEKLLAALHDLETKEGRALLIRARSGVVLATGGFPFNREQVARYNPGLAANYPLLQRLAMPGSDGSGIELGVSVGGATGYMDSFLVNRVLAPPAAQVRGVLVNEQGRRFVNEDAYIAVVGSAISKQSEGTAWLIFSARDFRRTIRQSLFSGWYMLKFFGGQALLNLILGGTKRHRRLDRLAAACGIDPAALVETAMEHDRAIVENRPDELGKVNDCRDLLGDGPYYAVNMSMWNRYSLTIFMTLGGLTVNEETGAVTRADGSEVTGLHAAGMSAVGLHSNGYISGLSLADGVFSGRRAGRHAAAGVRSSNETGRTADGVV